MTDPSHLELARLDAEVERLRAENDQADQVDFERRNAWRQLNLAYHAAMSDVAKLAAEFDEVKAQSDVMRPVVAAAVAWRDTWRHRHPFGEESKAVALVDAVDAAVAAIKEQP